MELFCLVVHWCAYVLCQCAGWLLFVVGWLLSRWGEILKRCPHPEHDTVDDSWRPAAQNAVKAKSQIVQCAGNDVAQRQQAPQQTLAESNPSYAAYMAARTDNVCEHYDAVAHAKRIVACWSSGMW